MRAIQISEKYELQHSNDGISWYKWSREESFGVAEIHKSDIDKFIKQERIDQKTRIVKFTEEVVK